MYFEVNYAPMVSPDSFEINPKKFDLPESREY